MPRPHEPSLIAVMAVSQPGGAEIHLLRLLDGLAARGWRLTLTTPGPGPLRDRAAASGWRWLALPVGGLERRAGATTLRSWPAIRRLARHTDVMYLNGGVCGRLLPALAGAPGGARRVLHIHDLVDRTPRFWRLADLVLADSHAVAERLAPLTAEVVYGPVDPDPPPAIAPWPAEPRPVIGFVGRVEPRKRPLDLVHAAPLVRRRHPQARFVIVGDDPFGADPRYTQQVITAPEVEHFSWVENAPGLMRHLDVLVLPSEREPFGTVLAEAMIVGTPVVATRVGGLAEVVRDGVDGRLVSPGDPAALADAILEVLSRRPSMSAAAREGAARFAAPVYVERVSRLLGAA